MSPSKTIIASTVLTTQDFLIVLLKHLVIGIFLVQSDGDVPPGLCSPIRVSRLQINVVWLRACITLSFDLFSSGPS